MNESRLPLLCECGHSHDQHAYGGGPCAYVDKNGSEDPRFWLPCHCFMGFRAREAKPIPVERLLDEDDYAVMEIEEREALGA